MRRRLRGREAEREAKRKQGWSRIVDACHWCPPSLSPVVRCRSLPVALVRFDIVCLRKSSLRRGSRADLNRVIIHQGRGYWRISKESRMAHNILRANNRYARIHCDIIHYICIIYKTTLTVYSPVLLIPSHRMMAVGKEEMPGVFPNTEITFIARPGPSKCVRFNPSQFFNAFPSRGKVVGSTTIPRPLPPPFPAPCNLDVEVLDARIPACRPVWRLIPLEGIPNRAGPSGEEPWVLKSPGRQRSSFISCLTLRKRLMLTTLVSLVWYALDAAAAFGPLGLIRVNTAVTIVTITACSLTNILAFGALTLDTRKRMWLWYAPHLACSTGFAIICTSQAIYEALTTWGTTAKIRIAMLIIVILIIYTNIALLILIRRNKHEELDTLEETMPKTINTEVKVTDATPNHVIIDMPDDCGEGGTISYSDFRHKPQYSSHGEHVIIWIENPSMETQSHECSSSAPSSTLAGMQETHASCKKELRLTTAKNQKNTKTFLLSIGDEARMMRLIQHEFTITSLRIDRFRAFIMPGCSNCFFESELVCHVHYAKSWDQQIRGHVANAPPIFLDRRAIINIQHTLPFVHKWDRCMSRGIYRSPIIKTFIEQGIPTFEQDSP